MHRGAKFASALSGAVLAFKVVTAVGAAVVEGDDASALGSNFCPVHEAGFDGAHREHHRHRWSGGRQGR